MKAPVPIPSACPAPDGGVGRGSEGELANHAVLPSVTCQLLPYAGVVTHGRRPAAIQLNIALDHILRRVVSSPKICPGPQASA